MINLIYYVYVTGSWKIVSSRTFINMRNTNYKYPIQYISVMYLAVSTINLQLFRLVGINYKKKYICKSSTFALKRKF